MKHPPLLQNTEETLQAEGGFSPWLSAHIREVKEKKMSSKPQKSESLFSKTKRKITTSGPGEKMNRDCQ
jgi:hypothetical protein